MPKELLVGRRRAAIGLFTVDPASVATTVAAEQTVTVPGVRPGDVLMALPASGFNVGITVRASVASAANTLSFRCVNPTAAPVDAASSVWALANLRGFPQQTISINPASVGAASAVAQNVTVPGLRVGDCIVAVPPAGMTANVDFIALRVAAADTLPLLGCNPTIGAVDAAAGTWTLVNVREAIISLVTIALAGVGANTANNVDLLVPGVQAGDCLLVFPPANLTAGVFPVALRAAAGTLRLRVANPTAGPVTTANGVWAIVNLGHAT